MLAVVGWKAWRRGGGPLAGVSNVGPAGGQQPAGLCKRKATFRWGVSKNSLVSNVVKSLLLFIETSTTLTVFTEIIIIDKNI